MNLISKYKGILVTLVVLVILFFVYNLFFQADNVVVTSGGGASGIKDELLKLSADLQTVTLDQSLFSDPSYIILTDNTVTIPSQPIGRPNPFAPLNR